MLFYSKASQYALRALAYLVKNRQSPCLAETIASQEEIPKPFLSKILMELTRAKFLKSTRGPGGGFTLNRDPTTVSLYEVINVFDDLEESMKVCAIGKKECSDQDPCELHDQYKALRQHVRDYFESVSLETFAEVTG